jgi:holo-[acyl-carrier protein] synthase
MIVGSGVDVIEIARIERVLGDRGERFERRIFTPAEIEECHRAARPAPHFAVRFAAKEAVMKAVGTGWGRGVRWVDIETDPVPSRLPGPGRIAERLQLTLRGAVGEHCRRLANREGADSGAEDEVFAHLAVSRSRTHAIASVLLEARAR